MFGIVINEQGYRVEFVVLNEDKSPQFYTLKDGESIVEDGWSIANGMNKPMWNGSEWIDTDPLPPVDPPVQEPSEMEILSNEVLTLTEQNVDLDFRVLMLEFTLA